MKQLKQITFGIAATCLLFSCNKTGDNNNGTNDPQTPTIVGTWKAVAMESDKEIELGIGPSKNYFLVYDSCSRDNLETYSSATSGVRTYDEGPTKCDPDDPQTQSNAYTYANNFIDFGGGVGFKVVKLEASRMQYQYPVDWETEKDTFQIMVTVTLQKQ